MSYIQFQQVCLDCRAEWNAAFGVVGMMLIAEPPTKCPICNSTNITKLADGWKQPVFELRSYGDKMNHGRFTAWLIEYVGAKPCPVYIAEQDVWHTCNPWAAKRFESQEKAEAYMLKRGIWHGTLEYQVTPRYWHAIEHTFGD